MDNYKIKVKNEAESKEAQGLFFELGYKKECFVSTGYPRWIATTDSGEDYWYSTGFDLVSSLEGFKEITLPQLRDLVVLKRNDINDATHVDPGGTKHIELDGRWYWFHEDSTPDIQFGWVESASYREYNDKVLKPIQKNQDQGLISRKEAKLAWANGEDVEYFAIEEWRPVCGTTVLGVFDRIDIKFRIKLKTIKLDLEIPAPFEPKDGDVCFTIDSDYEEGVYEFTYREDSDWHKKYIQFGVWDSLEKAEKVVEALRSIKK